MSTTNDVLRSSLGEAQTRAHTWGANNRVSFDPSKEAIRIIHPEFGDEEEFVLLGTVFDCRLSMESCLSGLLKTLRAKVFALTRIKHIYDIRGMLNQFKAHIWSKMEYYNGAILIAGEVRLRKLDKMQRGYLYALGLTDKAAFVLHNFAPPSLRRAIGILGFLHKINLGTCHPALRSLFPPSSDPNSVFHSMQLESFFGTVRCNRALYSNSIYMYILIYNRLPQAIVDMESVSSFQGKLTQLAKLRAERDEGHNWRSAFQSCQDVVNFFYSQGM